MKKNLFRLMALMMVAMLTIGFTSCSKDDDEPEPPSTSTGTGTDPNFGTAANGYSIIGTWKNSYGNNDYELITFSQDGTYRILDYENGRLVASEYGSFTITSGSSVITLSYYDSEDKRTYTHTFRLIGLTATTMSVFYNGYTYTFVRQ